MSQTSTRPHAISAAVICFNEEQHIGRCLDSLSWCDQVVVVDSGSTDRTPRIVNRFPNTEFYRRPLDNFINQKNHALSLCRNEWTVSLDADEMLTSENVAEIQSLAFDKAGYCIGRRSFIGDREIRFGTWSPDYQLRIFRKSRSRWGGTNPHESIQIEGNVGYLKSRMLHFSYETFEEFVARNTKYARMMVDYLDRQGRTTYTAEPYLHCVGNFIKAYLLRGGFLDGSAGFFLARHIAGGSFLKYRLLAERQRLRNAG
jgi:glycosyltransferase involved in cell wall biosynthesis